ncbi:MAG: thermonuclease family protein [Desulfomonile tiedjei]|uniref:Thermonuclease family protein n=1 Tax=Desulfomonile tiedjei TaxID=2358 RepID=A0A9D6Z3R7_9BACT|nr:thermonuclease family protein [Desulfomonile tiedjei]
MAKMRLQSEWKIWVAIAALIVAIIGYLYVVSRPPMEGGEYLWKITKIDDERTLTVRGSGIVMQVKLIGLRIPKGQEAAAKDYLAKTLENNWVKIKVLREEPKVPKEVIVFLSVDDINAKLIRQGFAEIDRDEKTFDIRPYIELEQEAQREKRGMWSQAIPGAK